MAITQEELNRVLGGIQTSQTQQQALGSFGGGAQQPQQGFLERFNILPFLGALGGGALGTLGLPVINCSSNSPNPEPAAAPPTAPPPSNPNVPKAPPPKAPRKGRILNLSKNPCCGCCAPPPKLPNACC